MKDNLDAIDQIRSTAIDLALKFGPRLLTAVIIVVVGVFAARWAARATARLLRRVELEPPALKLLQTIVRIVVLLLFVIMALQNLGVELLPVIAGLGVAGAGVALAMQGVLSNIVAGLTIILTRPFRVGEYISIVKEEGCVEDVSLFNTTLSHADRSRVVIPNRRVVGEILHNYGQIRQLPVTVQVAFDADLDKALAVIQDVVRANARCLPEPAPVIQAQRLADSSVSIFVGPWVKVADYPPAVGEINKAIVEAFRGHGLTIPLPRHEVRLVERVV
jgi:small conductance mechanosensitive channel